MQRWEYAVGHQSLNSEWSSDTDSTTFEAASRDLIRLTLIFGHEDWAHDLRVIKRSEKSPGWRPVHDHAAELLAEAMADVAGQFSANGRNIMQGVDLHRMFNRLSKSVAATLPSVSQEFDQ